MFVLHALASGGGYGGSGGGKMVVMSCSRPRSVEELARYFGCQLRELAGGMWQRVVFDVAVSSGPGQAGIVRFAGCGFCFARLHLIPTDVCLQRLKRITF